MALGKSSNVAAAERPAGSEPAVSQAVILAGGLGTRLGTLTRDTPKPLLPVGGRPFLKLLVEELHRYGLAVVIVAGFEGRQIAGLFDDDQATRVVIEPRPLGTGGALRFALPLLAERFFLLNGDSLFDFNLLDLQCGEDAGRAQAVLSVRQVDDAGRFGAVRLEGHRIVRFADSAAEGGAGLINGGVVLLARSVVEAMPADQAISIEKDVYPRLAAAGTMVGRRYDRPFIDIGVSEDYARAQEFVPRILKRGAVIFDRDGVLNEDTGYVHRSEQVRWIPGAIEAVKIVNDAGLLALVATNQAGVARGFYEERDILVLHDWLNRRLMVAGAHIDAFAYSPYHPEGIVERYRKSSDCRKPGPGMVVDLLASTGADPARSIMIGDKQSDVEAAEAAGIRGALFPGGNLADFVSSLLADR